MINSASTVFIFNSIVIDRISKEFLDLLWGNAQSVSH